MAHAGVAVAALLFASPVLLMLSAALQFGSAGITLHAFADAIAEVPLIRALLNSLWICAAGVPLALALSSMAAFALTQLPPRPRNTALLFLLLSASAPLTAVLVPRFVLYDTLGVAGTVLPVLAPALIGGTPLACLLLYAALRRLPQEHVDTARIEGLGWWSAWWQIAVPQTRPTHGAVLLLILLGFWGAFMEPLLYLHREDQLTAPLMLHAVEMLGSTRWPLLMATASLITLPVLLAVALLAPFLHQPFRSH